MGLTSRTLSILRQYWAERLGVTPDAFLEAGVTVGRANEGGVSLFCHGDAFVIGAPNPLVRKFEQRCDSLTKFDSRNKDEVQEWFINSNIVEKVLGPAFWGYTDRQTFNPVISDARVMKPVDESDHDVFRAAIPDDDWEQGGLQFNPGETVGLTVDDNLVAISGYEVWDDLIAHLAVVTHPNHRGEGYGQAVVSRATEKALSEGLIPQYRTLDAWPWSVSLAQRLGFKRFATGYLGVNQQ